MYFEYANFELIFKLKIAILSINCVCYMKCNMRSRIRQRLNAAQSGTSPKGLSLLLCPYPVNIQRHSYH
jgi:hypothetical protein